MVEHDKHFYYISGVLGMKNDGTFTDEKRHWMTFTRETAIPMQEGNEKPVGATQRGVFVATESGARLKLTKPVTPQVPGGDMEKYIKVAADSIEQLRKIDVYRVLVESNRVEFRQAIASYIKSKRPDLTEEVDEVLMEDGVGAVGQDANTRTPAKAIGIDAALSEYPFGEASREDQIFGSKVRASLVVKLDREAIARLYSSALAEGRAGVSPEPSDYHYGFADHILNKDAYHLDFLANGLNDVGKRVFTEITGVALPKQQGATWAIIREWGGISLEVDNKNKAWRHVVFERQKLEPKVGVDPLLWANDKVENGFDELKKVGRETWLVNADGQGFNLSRKGTHQTMLVPYLEAKIKYEQARVACEQSVASAEPNFNDFNQDHRYTKPVETRLVLSLPITDYRPEAMRVTERKGEGGIWFEVESFNATRNKWIDQKNYPTEAEAIADANGWYLQPKQTQIKIGIDAPGSHDQSYKDAEKIANGKGKLTVFDTNKNQSHQGRLIGVTDYHAVISLGRSAFIIERGPLNIEDLGQDLKVTFNGPKTSIAPIEKNNDKGIGSR